MRYAAPWDRTLKLSTAAAAIVILALSLLGLLLSQPGGPGGTAPFLVGLFAAAIVAGSWAFAPKGFAVERGEIRIERPLRPIAIPLSEVRSVGAFPDGALRGAMRLAGSGGLFGYYGRFWTRRLGSFRAYATRMNGLVQLDTARGRFVLSPDPADRFVEDVLARAPRAVRSSNEVPALRMPLPRRARIGLAVAVAAAPLAIGAILGACWAYSPRAASVEGGAIRIERELAGPVVIPLADVLDVDLVPCARAGRFRRVGGYAGRSVFFGRYRSDALGDFQLYAWRPGPYVLVDVPGRRYVLTPEAPEAFVAAVRAAIGPR